MTGRDVGVLDGDVQVLCENGPSGDGGFEVEEKKVMCWVKICNRVFGISMYESV